MSKAILMRGEQEPNFLERAFKRPRRLVAGILGIAALTGCVGDYDEYVPVQADVCTIVASPAMVIEYEADRWANGLEDRQRLEDEIEIAMRRTDDGPRYAVCVDVEGGAHATGLARMDNLRRYFGYNDEGFSGAGMISVPALLEQRTFAEQYQTAVDPDNGF